MDAHSFRILANHLIPLLTSARIDKIYGPLPDLTVFHCFGRSGKFQFAIQSHKQHPQYFLQNSALPNPGTPSPAIMRLRKYLINAHFGQGCAEITTRSICFPIVRKGETASWLMCSPSRGITVCHEPPAGFPHPAVWPEPEVLPSLIRSGQLDDPATWLAYPVFTPLLRKTIKILDPQEALALMVDLEAGGEQLFFYGPASDQPDQYHAWPLPEELCEETGIVPVNPEHVAITPISGAPLDLMVSSYVEEHLLQRMYSTFLHKDARLANKRELKKSRRRERALEQEEIRLRRMVDGQTAACLIQENLWKLDPEARLETITLTSQNSDDTIKTQTIPLNPALSIRDNMLDLFKKAEKGKRGLRIIRQRKQEYCVRENDTQQRRDVEACFTGTPEQCKASTLKTSTGKSAGEAQKNPSLHRWINLLEETGVLKRDQKDIAAFLSSNGYSIFRGKNAQGNKQLLKLSNPHDIWLHVQDGPSAHAVIKRDHAQEEIPEQTIIEAACLVAEKSWLKENNSASVMLALVKHVHSIKGAAAGTVRVEKILRTILIKREFQTGHVKQRFA